VSHVYIKCDTSIILHIKFRISIHWTIKILNVDEYLLNYVLKYNWIGFIEHFLTCFRNTESSSSGQSDRKCRAFSVYCDSFLSVFIADILANLFLASTIRSEARLEGSIGTARRLLNQRHWSLLMGRSACNFSQGRGQRVCNEINKGTSRGSSPVTISARCQFLLFFLFFLSPRYIVRNAFFLYTSGSIRWRGYPASRIFSQSAKMFS